jgi:hypothetical protein
MERSAKQYKSVLDYLRDMMELCQIAHRVDLARNYREAWETAATAVYGQLPPWGEIRTNYAPIPRPPGPPPKWREMILAKPYRKIIHRNDREEILECGHRLWAYGDSSAKRRRCGECVKSEKKPVSAVAHVPAGSPAVKARAAIA